MIREEKGYAVVLSLLVTSVVLIFAGALTNSFISSIKINQSKEENMKGFYLAEAGIERAIYDINRAGAVSDAHKTATFNFDNGATGSYELIVMNEGGCFKVTSKGILNGVKRSTIEVKIDKGTTVDKIIDNKNLHIVANKVNNYPWKDKVNIAHDSRLTQYNIASLFDFDTYKEYAQNESEQRYFGKDKYYYNRRGGWRYWGIGGENLFQDIYSTGGAGRAWNRRNVPYNTDLISTNRYYKAGLEKPPVSLPTDYNYNVPGGVFYIETNDYGFAIEIGSQGFKASPDNPAIIVVDGDVWIDAYQRDIEIDNVYFIVKGQVQVSYLNNYGNEEGDSGALPEVDLTTNNTFVYAQKNFKWVLKDDGTLDRKNIPPKNYRGSKGDIEDNYAAVSGNLYNNNWRGPVVTPETVDVVSDNKSGEPGYNSSMEGVDWDTLSMNGKGWGAGRQISGGIISWKEID